MEENKTVVTNENFDWNAFENDLGVYSQPKEEIAAAYDKTLSNVAVGEVVEGTVMSIGKREVVVNIGYKSEGIIPVSEFPLPTPTGRRREGRGLRGVGRGQERPAVAFAQEGASATNRGIRVERGAGPTTRSSKGYIKYAADERDGMIVDVFGIEAFLRPRFAETSTVRRSPTFRDRYEPVITSRTTTTW